MNVLARAYHATAKSGGDATGSFLGTITHLLNVVRPAAIVFAAEGGRGHRHQLHADYKSSRTETPDGLRDAIARTREAIEAIGWTILKVDGYEADDVLATISQRVGQRAVIATSDKDLLQLAGRSRIIDPYKRTFITASDVQKKYGIGAGQLGDWLALCGDKSDDVPGVPGVGPKKATELLTEFESLETILASAYPRQTGAGKVWANIWQHKAQALLSRRLVTLVDSLDLPMASLRRCYRPRAGWTDRLRLMGLGGSAIRLGSVLDDLMKEANHASDNLSRQPATAGSEGDGATQSDSHAADSRSGPDSTDLAVRSVCEAADSVQHGTRPDGEQRGASDPRTVQRDRSPDSDDTSDRPAWISDCVRAGFELITHEPHPITGNYQAMRSGRKYILHTSCKTITDMATVDSFTLKKFLEASDAA